MTFAVTMGLCMYTMPVTYCNDPVDPQVRGRIREEWSKEFLEHEKLVAEHEVVKAQWAWEDERHAALLHKWEQERVDHEQELKARAAQEDEQHAALLREWEQERVDHEQELKARAAQEDKQHAALLREWEQERVDHEWELKERAQHEEEERKRLGLFWGRVEVHQCKTYGTREYSAVLVNLPWNWENRIETCKATPLEVHGVAHLPTACEDRVCGIHCGVRGCLTLLGPWGCHWSMGDQSKRARLQRLLGLVQG